MRFWQAGIVVMVILFLCSGHNMGQARTYPPEIRGNVEVGEKYFSFFEDEDDNYEEEIDAYQYWRAYLRYQQRLKPYSYYYFRYEYQQRDYTTRDRFTSEMHELTGNLTYQLSDFWRVYLQMVTRRRDYPMALQNTYFAVTPSVQVNFYASDRTQYTCRYRWQHRWYPQGEDKDYNQHGLTFSFTHSFTSSFNLTGGYRLDLRIKEAPEKGKDAEHRFTLGFRLVIE